MLLTPDIDNKVFVIMGSPLNANDLVRARADIAVAMFFLCNAEVDEDIAKGKLLIVYIIISMS
jgi:hypothetical protein